MRAKGDTKRAKREGEGGEPEERERESISARNREASVVVFTGGLRKKKQIEVFTAVSNALGNGYTKEKENECLRLETAG